jgi:hypothetical protein
MPDDLIKSYQKIRQRISAISRMTRVAEFQELVDKLNQGQEMADTQNRAILLVRDRHGQLDLRRSDRWFLWGQETIYRIEPRGPRERA